MKILHLSYSDSKGGAQKAAYDLHRMLISIGVDSFMFVQSKVSDDVTVQEHSNKLWYFLNKIIAKIEYRITRLLRKKSGYFFTYNFLPSLNYTEINRINADIVHIHWVAGSFIPIKSIAKINANIIYTVRDFWPITGGCHYSFGCDKFNRSCHQCPQLNQLGNFLNITEKSLSLRKKIYSQKNVHLVGISKWMTDKIRKSTCSDKLQVSTIENCINFDNYKIINQGIAREILGITNEYHWVLLGAIDGLKDSRKGYSFIIDMISDLRTIDGKKLGLLIFGSNDDTHMKSQDVFIKNVGFVKTPEEMSLLYCAADVFVTPTLEEAFGKTIVESLACGRMVVAFDNSGPAEIIEHKTNGYLAENMNKTDLLNGIRWVLNGKYDYSPELIRKSVESKYNLKDKALEYKKMYESIIHN